MAWMRRFLRAPAGCARHGVPQAAEARTQREGPEEGGRPRNVSRAPEYTPPPAPPLQSALVALGCALLRRAVCACAEGPHPAAKEECARDAGARPRAHAHPACRTAATSGRRPAAKRTRTALCATAGGALGHHGGGADPRRPDASRCANRLPSVRPRAAARPVRPRARTAHCVSHPAPQGTPHRRAFPSPSTR